MKKLKNYIKKYREAVNDNGFSLLELVVAVGILLVLTVGGLLAYSGMTKNARTAAVQSAASEVLTGAVAYDTDASGKTPADAETEWNDSSKKDKDNNASITVDVKYSSVCIAVEAKHVKGERSVRSSGTNCPSDINTDEGYFGETPTKTLPTTTIGGGDDNTGNPSNPGGNDGENETPITPINPNPNADKEQFSVPDDENKVIDNVVSPNQEVSIDSSENTSGNYHLYGTYISTHGTIDSKMTNGGKLDFTYSDYNEHMAVGTDIYISEWITRIDGFKANSSVEFKGYENGFAHYTATSNRSNLANDVWFSVSNELVMTSGAPEKQITVRTVLPGNITWIDKETTAGKFYNSGNREVWEYSTNYDWASTVQKKRVVSDFFVWYSFPGDNYYNVSIVDGSGETVWSGYVDPLSEIYFEYEGDSWIETEDGWIPDLKWNIEDGWFDGVENQKVNASCEEYDEDEEEIYYSCSWDGEYPNR